MKKVLLPVLFIAVFSFGVPAASAQPPAAGPNLIELAGDPDTPDRILTTLSTHPSWRVREAVAGNTDAPSEVLDSLGSDRDVRVRRLVAENTGTARRTFLTLAGDSDTDVRFLVAGNRSTPLDVLYGMANDLYPQVRGIAIRNIRFQENLIRAQRGFASRRLR